MKVAESKRPRTGPTRRFRSRFGASRAGGGRGAPLRPVALAVGAALAAAAGMDGGRAAAQETIYIGDGGIDVIVNLGALDGLGREGARPIVIDPAMAGGRESPLRPPPSMVDAASAVAMPVAKGEPETGTAVGKTPPAAPERPLASIEAEPAPPAREAAPAAEEPAARAPAGAAPPSSVDTPAGDEEHAAAPDTDFLVLRFPAGEAALPPEGEPPLARLAERLAGDETLRLRLMAYASGDSGSASQTRRLSLSRALAVRSFLIERGMRSTRIDLRALGDRTEEEPADRVDVLVVER